MTEIQILHLEDDPADAELFVETLAGSGLTVAVVRVDSKADFIQALEDRQFDLIISDFSLPDFDGRSALDYASRRHPDTPFIFLSGTIGEDAAIESLVNGATDYVLKHKFARLAPAVNRALRESRERRERRQAEQAIHDSEAKYRRLFEESKDAIFIRTPEGRFIDINPAGIQMLGYESKEEVLAVEVSLLHADLTKCNELGTVIRRQGFVRDFEVSLKTENGAPVVVLETTTAVRDEPRNTVAYHGIWRDVTEQRKLERQFILSQRLESVGQLAGGIAHDFNNLLTVIAGYSELSMDLSSGDESLAANMTQIHKAVDRGALLTRQLLAFSRKQILQPRLVDLNAIVKGILEMIRPLIGEHIELTTRLAPSLDTVKVDPGQLEQVVMNLAINARDAMPGGGRLLIGTDNFAADAEYVRNHAPMKQGTYVKTTVSDNGTGMDSRTKERIFEPFFTTKEPGKGTGLGLAMVYGIVKQSGGYIWVKSQLGQGTTFTMYLPSTSELPVEPKPAFTTRAKPSRASETILLVEDQPELGDLLGMFLRRSGYEILRASDGEVARAVCGQHAGAIHLALVDVRLPKLSGPGFVQMLGETHPETHVVYMSGYAPDVHLYPGPADQAANYLAKPFDLDTLAAKVREILDGSSLS